MRLAACYRIGIVHSVIRANTNLPTIELGNGVHALVLLLGTRTNLANVAQGMVDSMI